MADFTFETHTEVFKAYMDRMRAICKTINTRFSVLPLAWFWRHRFRAMLLVLKGAEILASKPGTFGMPIGPHISKWREGSPQKTIIARSCLVLSIESRQPITVSQVEIYLENIDQSCSRSQIRATLQDGVDTGIYQEVKGSGSAGTRFALTKTAVHEMTDRTFVKMQDPQFVELARFTVAFDEMRRQSESTFINESQGKITATDHQGILERLYWGDAGRKNNE